MKIRFFFITMTAILPPELLVVQDSNPLLLNHFVGTAMIFLWGLVENYLPIHTSHPNYLLLSHCNISFFFLNFCLGIISHWHFHPMASFFSFHSRFFFYYHDKFVSREQKNTLDKKNISPSEAVCLPHIPIIPHKTNRVVKALSILKWMIKPGKNPSTGPDKFYDILESAQSYFRHGQEFHNKSEYVDYKFLGNFGLVFMKKQMEEMIKENIMKAYYRKKSYANIRLNTNNNHNYALLAMEKLLTLKSREEIKKLLKVIQNNKGFPSLCLTGKDNYILLEVIIAYLKKIFKKINVIDLSINDFISYGTQGSQSENLHFLQIVKNGKSIEETVFSGVNILGEASDPSDINVFVVDIDQLHIKKRGEKDAGFFSWAAISCLNELSNDKCVIIVLSENSSNIDESIYRRNDNFICQMADRNDERSRASLFIIHNINLFSPDYPLGDYITVLEKTNPTYWAAFFESLKSFESFISNPITPGFFQTLLAYWL